MSATFEKAFRQLVIDRIDNSNFSVSWDIAPEGQPEAGEAQIVIYYAPGGDRQITNDGPSSEHTRSLQFSVFGSTPQDSKDAAKALHDNLDGLTAILTDGTKVNAIIPTTQDISQYIKEEEVYQTVFGVNVNMGPEADLSPTYEGVTFDARFASLDGKIIDAGTF